MTKKSLNRMNRVKTSTDEGNEVNKFIYISLIIIGLLALFYGGTELINNLKNKEEKPAVNYDILSIGNMLNAPYEEYYVLLYSSLDEGATEYDEVKNSYLEQEEHQKLYYVDLSNHFNKEYFDKNNDGKGNSKAKSIKDFDFVGITLLEVKNGEITSYIEGKEDINKTLSK